ncbi:MAG: hypothetical protein AB1724_15215 [Thermodesulfobacteriota bacterium]
MTAWIMIFFWVVGGLILYLVKYRKQDQKTLRAGKYRKSANHNEEYLIPLFDEHRGHHRKMTRPDPEDHDDVNGDHSDF